MGVYVATRNFTHQRAPHLRGWDVTEGDIFEIEDADLAEWQTEVDNGSIAESTLYSAGGTDVAVADGGTGASTAAAARSNLGVDTLFADAEARDIFAGKADGFPSSPTKGAAYSLYGGSVGLTARPTVVSGKLTQAVTPAASYAQLQLAGTGRRIGGRFTFSSGSTTDNGSAVLALLASPYAGVSVPDCSVHLVIKPTAAIFGVWASNVFTTVSTWTFASPLAADGATVHSAEVFVDTANDAAYCFLPDGTVRVASHATIGLTTPDVAVWEIYTEAGTDPIAAFTETWADSTDPAPLPAAIAAAWAQPTRCAQYNTTGVADSFVPTTSTAINASALTISTSYPPSGKLLITCSANYRSLSSGQRLFWDFYYGATNLGVIEPLTDQPADDLTGTRMGRLMLTGTPGAAVIMEWRHRALASNQVIFQVDTFRPAIMTVEPVR